MGMTDQERKDAIQMNTQRKVVITVTYNDLGMIIDTKAEELDSSAQPERKRGHWMPHHEFCKKHGLQPFGLVAFWWCDRCEKGVEHPTNFCPNCGADMRGEKDD